MGCTLNADHLRRRRSVVGPPDIGQLVQQGVHLLAEAHIQQSGRCLGDWVLAIREGVLEQVKV
jgi:hypothetical protein